MELVCGCYEQVLFGFSVHREPGPSGQSEKWTPVADFTHHGHAASLSAVAVNNRFVVTGSRDETIHIYDMKKKVEHGALMHHNGTINCLKFFGNGHLISGGEDGLICIWDAKRWDCLKSIKAHKGHVTSLSVHPSGKLALSVGTDKTLRTWNLIEGRSAFIKNIKQNAHIVEWSPSGEKYVVVTVNKIDIYQLETASVTGTITTGKRISSVTFISDSILAVAGDEEIVRLFDCDSLKCRCEFKAHENRIVFFPGAFQMVTFSTDFSCVYLVRVKDICSFEVPEHHVIVTASSDGFIKMWRHNPNKKTPPSLLCQVNTKARLTCLGVWLDRVMDTKDELPTTAAPSVNKEEEFKTSPQKSDDSDGKQQQSKKFGWTKDNKKPAKAENVVSVKKRKLEGILEKKKKKKIQITE